MEIGIYTFAERTRDPRTGHLVGADQRLRDLLEEIELADQVGLDVFGVGEHHRPDYLASAPAVVLAAAAARTRRIRLTSAVTVLSSDDPVRVFQDFATLDLLSGGRFDFGIGFGWNHDEMENHGIDVKRRRARVRETMLAMQALWSQEVASFEGEFVRFAPSWQWPKPIQQPRPRVLLGGAPGPTLFRHIAEYGDGWLPIGGAGLREALDALRAAVEAAGRDFASLHIVPMGIEPSSEKLAYYRALGVTEAVLRVPSAPRNAVMPVLDRFARDYL